MTEPEITFAEMMSGMIIITFIICITFYKNSKLNNNKEMYREQTNRSESERRWK